MNEFMPCPRCGKYIFQSTGIAVAHERECPVPAAQAALRAEPPMCYWHAHRVEVINGLRYHVVKTNRRNYLCLCAVEEGRWNAVAGEQAALAPPLTDDPTDAPTSGPPGRHDDDVLGAGEATSRDTSGELYSVRTMKAQMEIWKAEMAAVARERDDVKRVLEYTRGERNQAEMRAENSDLRARLAACEGQLLNAGANVARYMDRLAACESRLADTPENLERVARAIASIARKYGVEEAPREIVSTVPDWPWFYAMARAALAALRSP